MKIFTILLQIFIIILTNSLNISVIAQTDQLFDPDIVRLGRRFVVGLFQHNNDLREAKRFQKVQTEISKSTPFYCDAKNGPGKRSSVRPTSIHQLRPGDIDIIAAIGDSLTSGIGLVGTHLADIPVENRGMVFSIGGQGTWRQFTTLPNILKEFNPKLYGYALGNGRSIDRVSKFNVAVAAATSYDVLYMAKVLKLRLKHDRKVNMTNHWKLVTIFIGGIDHCHSVCYEKNSQLTIDQHKNNLVKVLRYLRDNIPRIMVNIVPPPDVRLLFKNKRDMYCHLWNSFVCPCYTMKSKKWLDRAQNILYEWNRVDQEIADRDEFQTNEFTVNIQSFISNFTIPTKKNGMTDLRYFGLDCLHFSQRLHGMGAIGLWNNMLEYNGEKNGLDYRNYVVKCPTEENPFITTKLNKKI